jgi:hypothetical protein
MFLDFAPNIQAKLISCMQCSPNVQIKRHQIHFRQKLFVAAATDTDIISANVQNSMASKIVDARSMNLAQPEQYRGLASQFTRLDAGNLSLHHGARLHRS